MGPFNERVQNEGQQANDELMAAADRLRRAGLVADAGLADAMAQRMTKMRLLKDNGGGYFDSVADFAGMTAKGIRQLTERMRAHDIDLGDLVAVGELMSKLSSDCLVQTQPLEQRPTRALPQVD